MRFLSAAVCTTVAAALLAACSSNGSSPSSSAIPGGAGGASKISQAGRHGTPLMTVDKKFLVAGRSGFHGRHAPASAIKGLYAQQFLCLVGSSACAGWGYPKNNSANGPFICTIGPVAAQGVNGMGVDKAGNTIVPDAFNGIYVFSGGLTMTPDCGTQAAVIPDAFGQAADGASNDAMNGTIVVGHSDGDVATCTVASNSCTLLSPILSGFVAVAMDSSGNCYAQSSSSGLYYWAGCTGTGTLQSGATGGSGGLDVDNKGNVLSLNQGSPSTLTVYHCASNICSVVTSTSLSGAGSNDCVYGHLGKQNERYACGDYTLGQIDVYTYLPSRAPTYLYSFNNGLTQADVVETAAYSPSSRGN
jgi:hypothetical protein